MASSRSLPLLYLITDRRTLRPRTDGQLNALIEYIGRAIDAGVDLLQIRERDLPARDLLLVADAASRMARASNTRILVNDRVDVAVASNIGVHLRVNSLNPLLIRGVFGSELLMGASTHSFEEAEKAERGGADFVVFGPIFQTESKRMYGPPAGVEALAQVTSRLKIPVLALGGIDEGNFQQALDAGAAGIAGISIFAEADDLKALVGKIKNTSG